VQTGGVWPTGLDGLEMAYGPPVKVMTGFAGERVPAAANAACVVIAETVNAKRNAIALGPADFNISRSLLVLSGGSRTTSRFEREARIGPRVFKVMDALGLAG
jgi:hypothetical protein